MSQKVVIADNYAVFRAGLARFLVDDLPRFYKAVETLNGAIVVVASSLHPNLSEMTERAKNSKVRFVVVLDVLESPQPFLRHDIQGVLYRDVSRDEMLKCMRIVARGSRHIQHPSKGASVHLETDMVGQRARDRLSKKELQIIGLIVQGYKNKDIALELHNSEQVIKNYLRSIFDKTGVSDRLELALFTLHHRILLDAAGGTGGREMIEARG